MPFGLFNAPTSFWNYINKILVKNLYIFVIVYLDDIFIYIGNQSYGYVKAMQWVLNHLQKYDFYINSKKCSFH